MPDDEPKYRDAAWLREQYVERERTMADIADELGCSDGTVCRHLHRHNIDTRDAAPPAEYPRLTDSAWLREQYVKRERSMYDIADELGCGATTVGEWLQKYNIEARAGNPPLSYPRLADSAWLREQYVERERSMYDIADELGCSHSTVQGWLYSHNIETRRAALPLPDSRLKERAWLREQYVKRERSMYDIADKLGCSAGAVMNWLHEYNIDTRDVNPSGKDHPQWNGGSYPYGDGWTESKKRTVRERDGFACVRCGRTQDSHREEYGTKLHVHHIVKAREIDDPAKRNAVENLVTLCRDCHRKYERLADAGLRPQISGVTAND